MAKVAFLGTARHRHAISEQKAGVKFMDAPVFMSPQIARDAVGILMPSIAARMDETIARGHGADDLAAIAVEVV